MSKYRNYKHQNTVSDKRRHMSNQGIQSIESVVSNNDSVTNEILYHEFVAWAQYKRLTPDVFRYIYKRYYDEFIGGL